MLFLLPEVADPPAAAAVDAAGLLQSLLLHQGQDELLAAAAPVAGQL
jgi:hypothetical protein